MQPCAVLLARVLSAPHAGHGCGRRTQPARRVRRDISSHDDHICPQEATLSLERNSDHIRHCTRAIGLDSIVARVE